MAWGVSVWLNILWLLSTTNNAGKTISGKSCWQYLTYQTDLWGEPAGHPHWCRFLFQNCSYLTVENVLNRVLKSSPKFHNHTVFRRHRPKLRCNVVWIEIAVGPSPGQTCDFWSCPLQPKCSALKFFHPRGCLIQPHCFEANTWTKPAVFAWKL